MATFSLAGCLGSVLPSDPGDYEIVQYSLTPEPPEWCESGESGYLDVFVSEDEVQESLDFEDLSKDRRDEVESFVGDTDFEERVLVYVDSVGPSTCYNEIEVWRLGMEDTTLSAQVAATDTSEGDVDCGGAVTHPSALLRPEFDTRPERVEMTIGDGWDERETIKRGMW